MWRENLDRIPDGWRLTLTDLSPGMVETAQGHARRPRRIRRRGRAGAPVRRRILRRSDRESHALSRPGPFSGARRDRARPSIRAGPSGRRRSASTTCDGCASSSAARGRQWEKTRERFTIEQVPSELAAFFVDVEIEPYPDSARGDGARAAARLRPLARRRGGGGARAAATRGRGTRSRRRGSFHVTQGDRADSRRKP